MNKQEIKCSSILFDMVENYGLVGVKTSFEDEGATFNDTIRLKEVCNQGKTKLTLKIGGPEAIRDIKDSMIIGVKGLVAPMVESAFGLKKFIQAVNNNIPEDVRASMQLGFNAETIQAAENIDDILNIPEADQLYGITIGRVDLTASQGLDRKSVDSEKIYDQIVHIFDKAKSKGLKCCLGGAISINSEKLLNKLHGQGLLDKFETRYAIYDPSALKNFSKALYKGQEFEIEWMKNKMAIYSEIANSEVNRIRMIEDRLKQNE